VQYTERFRLVLHGGQVHVAPLGRLLTAGRVFPPGSSVSNTANQRYFPATAHDLSGDFLAFWQAHDGASLLGMPIAEADHEQNGDGSGYYYRVQWLENARLEYHPEQSNGLYVVSLGLLGDEALQLEPWMP